MYFKKLIGSGLAALALLVLGGCSVAVTPSGSQEVKVNEQAQRLELPKTFTIDAWLGADALEGDSDDALSTDWYLTFYGMDFGVFGNVERSDNIYRITANVTGDAQSFEPIYLTKSTPNNRIRLSDYQDIPIERDSEGNRILTVQIAHPNKTGKSKSFTYKGKDYTTKGTVTFKLVVRTTQQ
jgi:hypothetical protein